MKFSWYLILALLTACNTSQKTVLEAPPATDPAADPSVYAQSITEEELKEHLYIYASDEFEGRETGEPGQKKAVEYLKKEYETMEVKAAMDNGEYFQEVPLEMSKLPTGSMTIGEQSFTIGEDFVAFKPAEGQFQELVYVNYGVDAPSYSDYANLDVQGKVVLMKSGEPKDSVGNYLMSGDKKPSDWSKNTESISKKREAAHKRGAAAVLFYDSKNYARIRGYYNFMAMNDDGQMALKENGDLPALILLEGKTAEAILTNIKEDSQSRILNVPVILNLESSNINIDSENVIAYIPGSEKPDEFIVISSHLDHIGVSRNGKINNGADDDGSGTVAMLEIAEAFKQAVKAGNGPKRSIVFLHVTGEEKGLLGSQYYTDVEPIFPLSNTVVNLNIDMIGRIDPKREGSREYVYLIGSDKLSQDLHLLSERINDQYTQLELDYTYNDENDPNRFYYRSDHYNFAKNNIPIIFYFNGTHDDYHRPGDTPDKINYDLLAMRSQLIFHTAWEIANREERVVVDKDKVSK